VKFIISFLIFLTMIGCQNNIPRSTRQSPVSAPTTTITFENPTTTTTTTTTSPSSTTESSNTPNSAPTNALPAMLSAPTGALANINNSGVVFLYFNQVQGALKYRVSRTSGPQDGNYELFAWIDGNRPTNDGSINWNRELFQPGARYYFKISTLNSAGQAGPETVPVGPVAIPALNTNPTDSSQTSSNTTILPLVPVVPPMTCNVQLSSNSVDVGQDFSFKVNISGGSGPFALSASTNLASQIDPFQAGNFETKVKFTAAGEAAISATVTDHSQAQATRVTCRSTNIRVLPTRQVIYRMDDFQLVNDNLATWGSMAHYYTQSPEEAGTTFVRPLPAFYTYSNVAGADCTVQLYKCAYFRPQGDARQFLSPDPKCYGHLLNGAAQNKSIGFVCTSQKPGTVRLYEWYRAASDGRIYSPQAESQILVNLGYVRQEIGPGIFVPVN